MNLAKLQDTKSVHRNYLHFYKLTTKNQTEIKESISFTIATKRIKYLGINLPKAWVFIGRPDAKAETPILWPTHEKS